MRVTLLSALGIAILAGPWVVALLIGRSPQPDNVVPPVDGVAIVDGVVISRQAYDEYADVFTTPDGSLRISGEDVLRSLVNQVLVQKEADRRGLAIPEEKLSAAIEAMKGTELAGASLLREGGEAALRERVRMFLLFAQVRAEVVGFLDIPTEALQTEYAADPSLHNLGFAAAMPVLRERLTSRESDRIWSNWLSSQRACSDILILDASFDVPSSTRGPTCKVTPDG